jgi:hypothetical protein
MPFTGSGVALQIGKESTWGSSAAGAKIIDVTSESIKMTPDKKVQDSLIASKAAPAKDLMGLLVDGDFSFILRPEYAGYLFHLAFGGVDVVQSGVPVASSYTHTIPLAEANGTGTIPSFTAIVDRRAAIKKYSGCKVATFDLEAAVGDYVKCKISLMGKDEATGTLATLAALALKAFKVVSAVCTIASTTYDTKKVTMKLDNKQEDTGQTYATGLYHGQPIHGQRETTLDIEMNYDATVETLHDTYGVTGVVISSIVVTLVSPSMVTGTTPYTVTLTFNNVSATIERNVSGTGLIIAKLNGTPTSVSTTEPVTVAIIDATAAAYSA